jgi:hypothetical protein
MTRLLARGVVRTFRLTNEPGGLGLSCTFAGVSLAGVPLLRRTRTPELSPEAALRLAKADEDLTKYNFNPDELRDWHGRWTGDGAAGSADYAVGDDIMRSIVKNACIAECSESSLPTYNFGWKFFNCVNDCMRRHGYDPFVIRP